MKELTLEVTDNCSLNCLHCSTEASPEGEVFFDIAKIKRIMEEYSDFDVVRISGGEPFNHPQIDKICKSINEGGRKVKILSCGVYYDSSIPFSFLEKIEPFVDEIIFSYHGDELLHEEIVSQTDDFWTHPAYWEILCDTIDNTTLSGIPYSFETVVMERNYSRLEDIAKDIAAFSAAREINTGEYEQIDWHVLRFVKQGRGRLNSQEELSYEKNLEIPKILNALDNCWENISISYSNSFEDKRCDCGSEKAVYTCYDKKIPCSALKGVSLGGKFACKKVE